MGDPTYRALLREAALHRDQGRVLEAIASYRRLLSRWPQSPNAWYNLALLERAAGQYRSALASYEQALRRGAERPQEIHLNRAVVLSEDLCDYTAAERELEAALSLEPGYGAALMNLGNLLEDLGRREAAGRAYQRILELEPARLEALARYSCLQAFSDPDDPLIDRLRHAAADPAASGSDRAAVGFALGRALDSCAEYAAAFDAYAMANRVERASVGPGFRPYDRIAQENLINRIIAAFPDSPPTASVANDGPQPVFILGMFRSGSTLVEQLLAGHPDITAGGELNFLPQIAERALGPYPDGASSASPARLRAAANSYSLSLQVRCPAAKIITDKRPDNFLYVGLIKRLFPRAKIVHTCRDPLDNCLSIFFLRLDHRMSYALDLMDIGHYYGQYRRLMAHWTRLFGSDIHDVCYDDLVRAPRSVVERLLAFLELDWAEQCLRPAVTGRPVRTASVWQVREPVYQHSSGRARHYSVQLEELRAYIESRAATPD